MASNNNDNNNDNNVIQLPVRGSDESNKNTFIHIKDPLLSKVVTTTSLFMFLMAAIFVNNILEKSQNKDTMGARQIASVGSLYNGYDEEIKKISVNELNEVYNVANNKESLIDQMMVVYLKGEYSVKFVGNQIQWIEFDEQSKALNKAVSYNGSKDFLNKFNKFFPEYNKMETVTKDSKQEVVSLIKDNVEVAKVRFQKTAENKLLSVNVSL